MFRMDHRVEQVKAVGDALSLTVVLGALAQVLPPLAALLAIVYHLLGIRERLRKQKEDSK